MKYKVETIGVELEYADIDTRKRLPAEFEWDRKDYSICNSNGTANDPKKKLNKFGSEIHSKPFEEVSKLVFAIMRLQTKFPEATLNFSTNLHVHIHVPRLRDDLEALKQLEKYYHEHANLMFKKIDPIPVPIRENFKKQKAFDGAWRRYKRRIRSHQYMSPFYDRLMEAKTAEDFNLAHYPHAKDGTPQYHLMQREGVNLAHLWKPTETIEFRHFTMTKDPHRLLAALTWPRVYLKAALYTGETPLELVKKHEFEFQPFFPYKYSMDKIFRRTNFHGRTRAQVEEEYQRLIKKGVLCENDLR